MKLPFLLIPRTVYEDSRRDLEAALKRNDELQQLLWDAKLEGAQILRTHPELVRQRLESRPVDLIDAAIEDHPKCRRIPALRRRFRQWADEQLADGKTAPWIVQRIAEWDKIDHRNTDDEDDEDRRMGLIA